jgi:hypothetical protein
MFHVLLLFYAMYFEEMEIKLFIAFYTANFSI